MVFLDKSPTGYPTFFLAYSRRDFRGNVIVDRENWQRVSDRATSGLLRVGPLKNSELFLIKEQMDAGKAFVAGRWLWVGGTNWIENPKNYSGGYNCTSTQIIDWESFSLIMDLGMQGSGTGAVLEDRCISQLPAICNRLSIEVLGEFGTIPKQSRLENTLVEIYGDRVGITVGDSRQGWVKSYQALLEIASDPRFAEYDFLKVQIDISHVRAMGEPLEGFGGVANPIKLSDLYHRVVEILNVAIGRQLKMDECCLLIDEAAVCFLAGNIRRSAGIRQFDADAPMLKINLWQQDENGNWRIDPQRDALRAANHTRVFHTKPTLEETINAVRSQYDSGEGAVMWAGEAVRRANRDLLATPELNAEFLKVYQEGNVWQWMQKTFPDIDDRELEHRLSRYGLNPCGEIFGADFHCVSGDTLIITRDSLYKIKDIVGEPVEVWNGARWSRVVPAQTGTNRKLYRIKFSDNSYLDCTDQHRFFVENTEGEFEETHLSQLIPRVKNNEFLKLEPFKINYREKDGIVDVPLDWAYTLGVAVGDGHVADDGSASILLFGDKANLKIQGIKTDVTERWKNNYQGTRVSVKSLNFTGDFVKRLKTQPDSLNIIASWNRKAILHFLAGLADTDGSARETGSIRIFLSNRERIKRVQLLLTKCGIRSIAMFTHNKGERTNFGIRKEDYGYVEIAECEDIPCQRLKKKSHNSRGKSKWLFIKAIEELPGLHDTYCFEEPEYHKAVFGNVLAGNCNLSEIHLNQIEPRDYEAQDKAFRAGALSVAVLLHHQFSVPRYQYSRQIDPIVGVSFTGLFDFFVKAFGVEWLRWWEAGRPDDWGLQSSDEGTHYYLSGFFRGQEHFYLNHWRKTVEETVWGYCDEHELKRPNRCTTVQPAGCLDRTALRVFDRGLLYADEIVSPGSGETEGVGLTVRGGIAADSAIANEPLPLVKITLKNGRIIRATPNHRFSVNGQWIESQHLVPGQVIDHSIGEYQNQENALLLSLNKSNYTREHRALEIGDNRGLLTKEITTPLTLTPDLAYFLGTLFGNGCLSKRRVWFFHREVELLERLKRIGESLFGVSGSLWWNNTKKWNELYFGHRQLLDWLKLNQIGKYGKTPTLDRIPELLRRSSRDTLLSFFAGLIDTNGCVQETENLSINFAGEAFVRNLQQIGEAIGLSFSVFFNAQANTQKTGNIYKQKNGNIWGLFLSPVASSPYAIDYLNKTSYKCSLHPILASCRISEYDSYSVTSVEINETVDYSYDFAISGADDDDSWYWQGALKSHNTKSLLTGASPGWHPPKAQRYIRRITFAKDDPVALACMDYGYNIVPSQSSKDETGKLLNDPFDPRCKEWLVEIPVEVPWANLFGVSDIDVSKFSALAQFDFYMTVQKHYVRHNASGTVEVREEEIPALADRIYRAIQDDEGYISVTLLARFDDKETYPRLPFEPIDKKTYERLVRQVVKRRKITDFFQALKDRDASTHVDPKLPAGPAGCDSDKCLLNTDVA